MKKLFLILAVACAMSAAPVICRADTKTPALVDRVIDAIQRYDRLSIFDDIKVEVDNAAVRLTGRVTTPLKRDEIGLKVRTLDGVGSLVNDIQVLPLSPFDTQLRQKIATAIYTYPPFWHYASMAVPPIHIVVEHGHVTLTGRVANQMDRDLAFARAQVPGAFSVTNELKIDGQ
jgi:hyperosmotically inducible protein